MLLKKKGALLIIGVAGLVCLVALFVLPEIGEDPLHVLTRLFALYGFLFLSMATLTTPFLKEVTLAFGKPFLKIHHSFSVLGLLFITLHPIVTAIQRLSLSVFVPRFASWLSFWILAGRPAFYIIYIALGAAILRKKAQKYWRPFHALMYVALLFGIVHANLIGEDFLNPWIVVIFNGLFIASLAGMVFKRIQTPRKTKAPAVPQVV